MRTYVRKTHTHTQITAKSKESVLFLFQIAVLKLSEVTDE